MSHVLVEPAGGWDSQVPQFERVEVDTDDELANVPATSDLKAVEPIPRVTLDTLRCIVCQLLPYTHLCQCPNNHLICAGCFQMRVLDKTLGSQLGTCPQCNVRIFRHNTNRNFTVEKMLADIVVECEKCGCHLSRARLRMHELQFCSKRLVSCKYKRLGCEWKGAVGQDEVEHEEKCEFGSKKAIELMEQLRNKQQQRRAKDTLVGQIMRMLQLPHISVRLLHMLPQMKSFSINGAVASATFYDCEMNWFLFFSSTSNSDTDSCVLYYQLCLSSPETCNEPITLTYTLITGTYSEVRFQPNIGEKVEFSSRNSASPMHQIYKNSWHNLSKLMNERGFYGRFIFVQH